MTAALPLDGSPDTDRVRRVDALSRRIEHGGLAALARHQLVERAEIGLGGRNQRIGIGALGGDCATIGGLPACVNHKCVECGTDAECAISPRGRKCGA